MAQWFKRFNYIFVLSKPTSILMAWYFLILEFLFQIVTTMRIVVMVRSLWYITKTSFIDFQCLQSYKAIKYHLQFVSFSIDSSICLYKSSISAPRGATPSYRNKISSQAHSTQSLDSFAVLQHNIIHKM